MATPATSNDQAIAQKAYAHPESLVSTDWLAAHLDDPAIRIIESDEDVLLFDTGHIPGAQKVDWHEDLNDAVMRDYISPELFEKLLLLICWGTGNANGSLKASMPPIDDSDSPSSPFVVPPAGGTVLLLSISPPTVLPASAAMSNPSSPLP